MGCMFVREYTTQSKVDLSRAYPKIQETEVIKSFNPDIDDYCFLF